MSKFMYGIETLEQVQDFHFVPWLPPYRGRGSFTYFNVLQQISHKDNHLMHLLLIDTRKLHWRALYFNLKQKVPVQNEAERHI